jgi:hypothetical protein
MGLIEVHGLSRGLLAANIASNAADVTVDGVGYVHNGVVMVTLRGDVASVQTAVDAAVDALGATGVVRAQDVIPRPDPDVSRIVAERSLIGAGRRGFGGTGGIGGFRSRGPTGPEPAPPADVGGGTPAVAARARKPPAAKTPRNTPRKTSSPKKES